MGPNPMTSVLARRKKTQAGKEKYQGEDDLKMEVENGVMCLLTYKRRIEKDHSQSL